MEIVFASLVSAPRVVIAITLVRLSLKSAERAVSDCGEEARLRLVAVMAQWKEWSCFIQAW